MQRSLPPFLARDWAIPPSWLVFQVAAMVIKREVVLVPASSLQFVSTSHMEEHQRTMGGRHRETGSQASVAQLLVQSRCDMDKGWAIGHCRVDSQPAVIKGMLLQS
jgi:hypothetical protein